MPISVFSSILYSSRFKTEPGLLDVRTYELCSIMPRIF
uniref:Uncharacterized protein n=1 Tax=Arundo donax TaxID=35708 RepID=A0A0A9B2Z0_ARUDO